MFYDVFFNVFLLIYISVTTYLYICMFCDVKLVHVKFYGNIITRLGDVDLKTLKIPHLDVRGLGVAWVW